MQKPFSVVARSADAGHAGRLSRRARVTQAARIRAHWSRLHRSQARSTRVRPAAFTCRCRRACALQTPACTWRRHVWLATQRDDCRRHSVYITECRRQSSAMVRPHARACEVRGDCTTSRGAMGAACRQAGRAYRASSRRTHWTA